MTTRSGRARKVLSDKGLKVRLAIRSVRTTAIDVTLRDDNNDLKAPDSRLGRGHHPSQV